MAVFTPSTQVILCSVPLEKDQKNQLDFASSTAQYNYFYSTRQFTYTNFTYQRKDNTLRVPAEFDTLYKCNYVMYQNANFGTKWFYAFIDSMEYINQNCTALHLKTDVFQTWILSAVFKPSFVAREHVANDAPWAHTLPESITSVEHKRTALYTYTLSSNPGNTYTHYQLCVFAMPDDGNDEVRPAQLVQGSYVEVTSLTVGHMRGSGYLFGSPYPDVFKELIEFLVHNNYTIAYTVAIPSDFMQTYSAVKFGNGTFDPNFVYNWNIYGDKPASTTGGNGNAERLGIPATNVNTTSVNGHTIRNKKLNCYPYRYLKITDNVQQNVDLKYELMPAPGSGGSFWFYTASTVGASPSYSIYPETYEGRSGILMEHGITVSGFPPVPYIIDYYSQYLALHKSSFETDLISNALNTASRFTSAAASGDIFGTITSPLSFLQKMNGIEDMMIAPPKVHGAPTGEAVFFNGEQLNIFDVYPTAEYLDILDDYFDFYGYNVSTVKTPQFTSRPYWNYIETKEINIEGDIPQDDMQELKDIFNRGVTVWHNPSYFLDYSRNNAPV